MGGRGSPRRAGLEGLTDTAVEGKGPLPRGPLLPVVRDPLYAFLLGVMDVNPGVGHPGREGDRP